MKNKVSIITGGTRGIGLGIARGFIKAGACVALVYRSDDKQAAGIQSDLGENCLLVKADVTNPNDRKAILNNTLEKWGCVDVLVNNAGISARKEFLKGNEEELNKVLATNLTAPIFLAQLVASHMIKQNISGSIINISSISAHMASHATSYAAAKAGLLSATKTMGHKLAPYNIRVNAITPGCFKTDMNARIWRDSPEAMAKYEEGIPMRRAANINEMAGTAIYLASDASSYTTGSEIIVDGGALLF